MKSLSLFFVDLIDRRPGLGYIGSLVPTAAGFWAFVESATKIGGLLSVALGLTVAVVTLRVQLLHHRRLVEEKKRRD